MAKFKALSETVISHLQEKIEQSLSNTAFEFLYGSDSNLELTESVDVWFLPADAVSESTDNLNLLARDVGEYHLQIKTSNSSAIGASSVPIAYVRTSTLGLDTNDWSVKGVFRSDLSKQIDQAIDWIDKNVPDDKFLVRLLDAPEYCLSAFWLIDESNQGNQKIIVVDSPSDCKLESFPKQYEVEEFLEKLRSVEHVQGLIYETQDLESELPIE